MNEEIENKIKKILEEKLGKDKFSYFLFGSRVKGNYRKNSDYDVGIYGNKKLDFKKYISVKKIFRG